MKVSLAQKRKACGRERTHDEVVSDVDGGDESEGSNESGSTVAVFRKR